MRKGVPLRLKPTDWESVFRSTKEEFCRPRSVRPFLQRRTKIHNRTSCRLRLMACRARGSGRQRATPTPSERGFSSRAITRTGITYSLHVMAGFTNFRVLVIQSPFESIHTSRLERSRWRGGRFACISLIRRWSLEGLTVVRYDDVNMDSDVSNISMSINNGLLTQLPSIQELPTQSRFKSHSSPRPPQTPAA